MKKIWLFIFLLPLVVNAQDQGNIWYFGQQAGLDFSSGSPVFVSGGQIGIDDAYHAQEGTTSISDMFGHLLMYSGGQIVWNRNNDSMPNGSGLFGGTSSTQSSLIVPLPDGTGRFYYLFTTDEYQNYLQNRGKGLRYNVIDMCADGGLGDVVAGSKNVWLMDSTSERLCAVADSQGTGYWILGRKMFTDEFYAWHLMAAGITDTVVSHVDTVSFPNGWAMGQGQMKFSPDGTKVAYVMGNIQPGTLHIFDFNSSSGLVTNPRHLTVDSPALLKSCYGVEFSPNGTKLYLASITGGGLDHVYQYDVSHGDSAVIAASRYAVYTCSPLAFQPFYGLQTGPDGNIYIAIATHSMAVIQSPDSLGAGAIFIDSVMVFPPRNNSTFTSFVAGYKYPNIDPPCKTTSGIASPSLASFSAWPIPCQDRLHVSLPYGAGQLILTDLTGQVLYGSDDMPGGEINMQHLSAGVYLLSYRSAGYFSSMKIIKE